MLRSLQGVYRKGRIELAEPVNDIAEETRVIVTLLEPGGIDLHSAGISEADAAELRSRLAAFEADWSDPAMSIYDDYDNARNTV